MVFSPGDAEDIDGISISTAGIDQQEASAQAGDTGVSVRGFGFEDAEAVEMPVEPCTAAQFGFCPGRRR